MIDTMWERWAHFCSWLSFHFLSLMQRHRSLAGVNGYESTDFSVAGLLHA